ncbi:AAA family ATPase [Streptosporangium sp. NPDC000396]|uniref:nucleotide-binding protein n=1 Tax=Streptosporangium sp. NPDC000396 TaxID=3366185 RepID=UPI003689D04B
MDDAIVSPYPKDPWSLVPAEPDASSSPLLRAAADPAYDPAGAPEAVADPPAEEADAADWMEAADAVSAFTVPSLKLSSPPSPQDNDGFLAPLKPLPRQEPGDADDYTPGGFTGPDVRTPVEPEQEPSRGLFEQPHRSDEAEPVGPVPAESPSSDFEPFKPAAQETEGFTFGNTDPGSGTNPGRDQFAPGGADASHGQFAPGGTDPGHDRFSFGGSEQDRDQFASGGTDPGLDRATFGGTDPGHGQFTPGGTESGRDQFTSGGTDPGRNRFVIETAESFTVSESLRPASERFTPEPVEPFRAPESFGADPSKQAAPSERFAPGSFGSDPSDSSAFASRGWDKAFASEQDTVFISERETAFVSERDKTPAPDHDASSASERDTPFASGRDAPSAPEQDTSFAPGRDAPSAPERNTSFAPGRDTSFGPGQDRAFTPERDTPFASGRDVPSAPEQDTAFVSERDVPFGSGQDRAFASERDTSFASGRDTAEPVREPYQARRRQSAPSPAFDAPPRQQGVGVPRPSADSLDPDSLLRGRRNAPSGGWRKLIYKASAGLIKPGESSETRRRRELVGRARTPVATGHHRVAVLSLKGGVGKTTTTVGLGATLAQIRGDRVIAVDANPDRGTLSDKVELETSATVRDLLNERQQIKRYVDIRAFTSQAPSRLEILASDRDPSVSEAFSASDYQSVAQVLENFYSICITDCGTGLLHSAMSGVLGLADQLVLVSSPSVDGARAASATLDWLEAHHYEELVRSATVVLCSVRPRSKSTVDLNRLEAHFAARCRAVIRVPYDPHLEEGAEIDLERLQPATQESYLRLAASVGDGFASLQR